jgi:hypothetical protein
MLLLKAWLDLVQRRSQCSRKFSAMRLGQRQWIKVMQADAARERLTYAQFF